MARRPRNDTPGSWHHITNRGISKRPLFETLADGRFFLARLVGQVRLGRIRIHAFSILTTHFHLLVSSPIGMLSEALRRSQNDHSREFNRNHKRDGSLSRGRFFSKPILSLRYRRNVVRYIDANPVKAGIVRDAREHLLGSRTMYAQEKGPIWLSRDWVEATAAEAAGQPSYTPDCYAAAFGSALTPEADELVLARIASTATEDPLDDLIGSTPAGVQAWMRKKAELADGCAIGLPVCGRQALLAALAADSEGYGAWVVEDHRVLRKGADLARVGMLRDLAGWKLAAIAQAEGTTLSMIRTSISHHRRLLQTDPAYGARAARVAALAIR